MNLFKIYCSYTPTDKEYGIEIYPRTDYMPFEIAFLMGSYNLCFEFGDSRLRDVRHYTIVGDTHATRSKDH